MERKSRFSMDPDIKVVVRSGYSNGGPTEDIVLKGASGFIGKPYGLNHMAEVLQSVLNPPPPLPTKFPTV